MDSGAPYVATVGTYRMRQLCVGCWATLGPGLPDVALNIEEGVVLFG